MEQDDRSRRRLLWNIFCAYFFSMLFAFTGGLATLSLLQQQLDDKYQLMKRERVLELFALGQALPGVLSLNAGILTGRELAGWPGGLAAAAGIITPAFCSMLFIAFAYKFINALHFIKGAIEGIRAASIALILTSAISIIGLCKRPLEWGLMIFAFVGTLIFGWNILIVILVCGCVGIAQAAWRKRRGDKCI